jgi:hypothetical protein
MVIGKNWQTVYVGWEEGRIKGRGNACGNILKKICIYYSTTEGQKKNAWFEIPPGDG